MKILAIETSCDETGLAIVEASGGLNAPKFRVVKNLVSSQIKIHRPFGGVVPNLGKREHLQNLPILYEKILGEENKTSESNTRSAKKQTLPFDMITVTAGPGLEPALWAGIEFAKKLSRETRKPLVGANHLEGHLYSFLLTMGSNASRKKKDIFPAIALIVSGGHTVLLRVESFSKWKRLGETRDDAAGEAFDKVARLFDLPYPGGPEVEKLARSGNPKAIAFPRPMLNEKNYDFSFSGLKTAVLYYYRNNMLNDKKAIAKNLTFATATKIITGKETSHSIDKTGPNTMGVTKADIAASFQQAAVDVLIAKTIRAARDAGARSIILCGGVAANKFLRKNLASAAKRSAANSSSPTSNTTSTTARW